MPDNILVVDDEREIADLVELYLQNENYAVFKFYSARVSPSFSRRCRMWTVMVLLLLL